MFSVYIGLPPRARTLVLDPFAIEFDFEVWCHRALYSTLRMRTLETAKPRRKRQELQEGSVLKLFCARLKFPAKQGHNSPIGGKDDAHSLGDGHLVDSQRMIIP